MKHKKGMSPLIAAVILIAATMSIAGILAYWTTGFVKTRLTEAESITGGAKCLGAEFQLRSGSYENNTLHLILDNRKTVDLFLTNLFLIYPDNKLDTKLLNKTLKGNEIKPLTIPDVDPGFLTGEIKTQCPDVSVYFTYSQVTE
jgi:flagellin-like protein